MDRTALLVELSPSPQCTAVRVLTANKARRDPERCPMAFRSGPRRRYPAEDSRAGRGSRRRRLLVTQTSLRGSLDGRMITPAATAFLGGMGPFASALSSGQARVSTRVRQSLAGCARFSVFVGGSTQSTRSMQAGLALRRRLGAHGYKKMARGCFQYYESLPTVVFTTSITLSLSESGTEAVEEGTHPLFVDSRRSPPRAWANM